MLGLIITYIVLGPTRSPGLGVWSLPENVAVLEEEYMAVNPSSNLAEVGNATFWAMVGGKGPYLPRGEAVMNESTSAVLQIARTVEFEETGYTGNGPTLEELRERGEQRRKGVEGERERARRMSAGAIGDVARGAGLTAAQFGARPKTVTRRASLGGQEKEGVESTHRYDRVRKEVEGGGRGNGGRGGEERAGEKGEEYYAELAVEVSEGKIRLEDLQVRDRERVIDLQRMAVAGESRSAGETGGGSGAAQERTGIAGRGKDVEEGDEEEADLILKRAKERLEERNGRYKPSDPEGRDEVGGGNEEENGKRNEDERDEDDEEEVLIKRRAEERMREKRGVREEKDSNEEEEESGEERMEEEGGERGRREEEAECLKGEEKYEEGEWGVCRLKKGDESGCVGVKSGGGKCDTASFDKTRYHAALGVLVLMK